MRRELNRHEEKQQEITSKADASAQSESKVKIRREFAEISPKLERIAYDTPPKVARERWQVLTQELRERLREEAAQKGIWLRINTLRDCYRATDSQLWRFGILIVIVVAALLISLGIYALYEFLRPQTSPDGFAAAWGTLIASRHTFIHYRLRRGLLNTVNRLTRSS